jgi:hypothetical protein
MQSKNFRKVRISFRIWNLSASQARSISSEIPTAIELKPFYKDKRKFVISFTMTNRVKARSLKNVLSKYKIKPANFGLFASIATERDSDGIRVPVSVVKQYVLIGGHLDFSFTVC